MSAITKKILSSIDYEEAKQKRAKNFATLSKRLCCINELDALFFSGIKKGGAPAMVYPFLCSDQNLRQKLLKRRVWVSQWWKYVLDLKGANDWEKKLSQFLIPLPVDQRYCKNDMELLADIVEQCVGQK